MSITLDDLDKIRILDTAFRYMTLDDVKSTFGQASTVEKLSGTTSKMGVIGSLIDELAMARHDISFLTSQSDILKQDLQILLRCLARPQFDIQTSNDFSNLKHRYGIYP